MSERRKVTAARGKQTADGSFSTAGAFPPQEYNLTDMPAPWRKQLLNSCGPESGENGSPSLVALFRSCRSMRDLVLTLHDLRLEVTLPIPPDQLAAAQAKLLLACKLSSRVKLHMEQQAAAPAAHTDPGHANICMMMVSAMAAAGHGLNAITHIKFAGLTLGALVPPWLIVTCPRMTSLHLEDCTFSGLPAPGVAVVPTCNQLTELHLTGLAFPNSPAMAHQLRSLTGLRSLATDLFDVLQCAGPVLGAQLTRLDLSDDVPTSEQLVDMVAWFPRLAALRMPDTLIEDDDMEVLLRWQHVTVMECAGCRLIASHAIRPCRWTHLGFSKLDIASFERLPLYSVQSLGSLGMPTITPCGDLAATNRVAEAISRRGGWNLRSPQRVCVENSKGVEDSQCLAAALAIINMCSPRVVRMRYTGQVTPQLLAAMKQQSASLPLTNISFSGCTWAAGVWPLLLPSLPPTVTEVTLFDDKITEAQLIIMCAYACRPVRVDCVGTSIPEVQWVEVWQPLVQRAMTAAGHQHVEINISYDE